MDTSCRQWRSGAMPTTDCEAELETGHEARPTRDPAGSARLILFGGPVIIFCRVGRAAEFIGPARPGL